MYWDQNTRAAAPIGFFFTCLVRGVPLALLYSLAMLPLEILTYEWLLATVVLRIGTAAYCCRRLGDEEGLRTVWLLPLRDLAGAATWAASFLQRKIYWKGRVFTLSGNRLVESV